MIILISLINLVKMRIQNFVGSLNTEKCAWILCGSFFILTIITTLCWRSSEAKLRKFELEHTKNQIMFNEDLRSFKYVIEEFVTNTNTIGSDSIKVLEYLGVKYD